MTFFITPSRLFLWGELAALSFVLPLILGYFPVRGALFASLWGMMLYALLVLRRMENTKLSLPDFRFEAVSDKRALLPVLRRFAISVALLSAIVLLFLPEQLFSLPKEKPRLWLLVMFAYPILSVIPQEIIFRSFFFKRYQRLFVSDKRMVWASSLAFGLAHVILQNWVAVALSTIGGWFFAQTYQKHRSLGLVWLEHALYGCFAFTIGLGWFFYSGAPHKW